MVRRASDGVARAVPFAKLFFLGVARAIDHGHHVDLIGGLDGIGSVTGAVVHHVAMWKSAM